MIRIEGKIVVGEGDIEERFIRPSDPNPDSWTFLKL